MKHAAARGLRSMLCAAALITAAVAGCGQNTPGVNPNDPYAQDPYGYGQDPYAQDPYGSDPYGSTGGYGNPGSTGSYGTGGGYGGTSGGYVPPPPTPPLPMGQLTVSNIEKKKSGILFWKKMEVSGKVTNRTQGPLSGELQITFKKKDKTVEAQYEFVTDLLPGESHTFNLKSKKSCDDVDVAIQTQPASPQAGQQQGATYGTSAGGSYGYTGGSYGNTGGYGSTGGYGNSTTGGYDPYGGTGTYGPTSTGNGIPGNGIPQPYPR